MSYALRVARCGSAAKKRPLFLDTITPVKLNAQRATRNA